MAAAGGGYGGGGGGVPLGGGGAGPGTPAALAWRFASSQWQFSSDLEARFLRVVGAVAHGTSP